MRFEVGAKIYARDASPELAEWCRENLVLDNPEYEKKQRMGFWTGNIPKQICLYERQGNDLCIPFGCISSLLQEFPGTKAYSLMGEGYHVKYYPDFDLYPYQKEAVRSALKKMNGVIVMPCGAGKTQTALAIIATLGLRALWLTHTQDLLNQSLNRAKSVFNNANSIYGTITSGKVNIGSGITFATVQTMSKLDLAHYRDVWNCVIVDEVQFATREQIDFLSDIVDVYDVPVVCYGLRADFRNELFPGSERLLAIADVITELKTVCWCGRKATCNARYNEHGIVREGEQVVLGANDSYVALCRKHFKEGKLKKE